MLNASIMRYPLNEIDSLTSIGSLILPVDCGLDNSLITFCVEAEYKNTKCYSLVKNMVSWCVHTSICYKKKSSQLEGDM